MWAANYFGGRFWNRLYWPDVIAGSGPVTTIFVRAFYGTGNVQAFYGTANVAAKFETIRVQAE